MTNPQLYSEQVAFLYKRQALLGIVLNAVLGILLVAVHWGDVPSIQLVTWIGTLLALVLLRFMLMQFYGKTQKPQNMFWGKFYTTLVIITGLLWGAAAFMLLPFQSPEQHMFFLLIVAGLAMGALPSLAALKIAAMGYAVAILLPTAVALVFWQSSNNFLFAAATVLFMVAALATAYHLHQVIVRGLQLRQENQALLREVLESKRDILTALPNRAYFKDSLERALRQSRHELAIVYLNIAQFRSVNESLGRKSGDALLRAIADRLREACPDEDKLARMSGDEFLLLVGSVQSKDALLAQSQALLDQLQKPYQIDSRSQIIKCYIGISMAPKDSIDADTLIHYAERAAKWNDKTQDINIYAESQAANQQAHSTQEQQVRRALENRELCLYYQPQVDLFNYSIFGFEALLRWNHPEKGVLSPDHVIPIAEEIGIIDDIGRWALEDACQQAKRWQQQGHRDLTVSVNVSAWQFMQKDFTYQVEQALHTADLAPEALKLELTESMLLPDAKHTLQALQQLQELGVQIALDDFGTGYASLSYLTRFPLDWLKIDKSFVQEVAANPDNAAIVTTTITLAHSLGMRIVAEGVEDDSQLAFIQRHHGDAAQGYYFSRPLPVEAASEWLRTPQLPSLTQSTSRRTVLLLEDDPMQRQLYSAWLAPDKYHIVTAADASEAFAMLAQQAVGVVLVDYVLPGIDGVEFLRRVRSIYPSTVRVMVSASTDRAALAKAINDGSIFRFLDKPVNGDLLRQTVRQAIAWQEKSMRTSALAG